MSEARSILLVDDDPVLGMMLPETMRDAGFDAVVCGSIADADTTLGKLDRRFAAIVLDVALPDGNGREFCRDLRQRGVAVPIVMLSGAAEEADVVAALDWGATDYVAKPFGPAELMARLRAVLRTHDTSKDASFDIGGFEFRPAMRMLTRPGSKQRIRMTDKESRLLRQLHHAGGAPVSREVLLTAIWGYARAAATHTLESHVYRLRQKIEANPTRPTIVLTSPGGYRIGVPESQSASPTD